MLFVTWNMMYSYINLKYFLCTTYQPFFSYFWWLLLFISPINNTNRSVLLRGKVQTLRAIILTWGGLYLSLLQIMYGFMIVLRSACCRWSQGWTCHLLLSVPHFGEIILFCKTLVTSWCMAPRSTVCCTVLFCTFYCTLYWILPVACEISCVLKYDVFSNTAPVQNNKGKNTVKIAHLCPPIDYPTLFNTRTNVRRCVE